MNIRQGIAMATALSFLSVAACDGAPEAPPPGPLPESACAKINAEMPALSSKAGLVFDTPTSLTMDRAAWSRMGQRARNELVQTIAIAAICADDRIPREQEITIRAEDGLVMTQRVVAFNDIQILN